MRENKTKVTIWTTPFVSVFFATFILHMSQYSMNTLVPRYVHYLGGSAVVVGIVTSVFAVTALAIRPFSGPSIYCFDKKKLMVLSSLITALAFLMYGFSKSITIVIAARLIHGIGIGFTGPLSLTLACEYLPEEKMAYGINVMAAGQAVSTAVGPGLGLALAAWLSYSVTFFIGVAAVILACVLMVLLLQSSGTNEKKVFKVKLDSIFAKEAIGPAIILICIAMSYSGISTYLTLYGDARGVNQIGLFFTAYAVALIVSRPLSGKIADKYGVKRAMIPGFICFALSYVVISISYTLTMFIIAGIISAFGNGIIVPNAQAMGMRRVELENRGPAANTMYTGMDVGVLIGGPLSGLIYGGAKSILEGEAASYSAMYLFMIVPIAIGAVVFLFIDRKHDNIKEPVNY